MIAVRGVMTILTEWALFVKLLAGFDDPIEQTLPQLLMCMFPDARACFPKEAHVSGSGR
ncbi:hypothetical protein NTCA1_18690 [Novosphingobium sp. TCA1]|nr:hypothetical protein NTCA1_18690 [Novosphingobium sp. TCA1]